MKPSDSFYFLKNNVVTVGDSLASLYQPIIGSDAYVVYTYLLVFFDHGRAAHRFTDILNQVQFGFDRLLSAFDKLGAMGLLTLYQTADHYLLRLASPLDREAFLNNAVLKSLLASRIGEVAVAELVMTLPSDVVDKTKRFSEVFTDRGEFYAQPAKADVDFDLEHFKQLMSRDGLSFADERKDLIALYRLADQHQLTWFDLYQLAKKTASQNQLVIGRLQTYLNKPDSSAISLSPEEEAALRTARSHQPEAFLSLIKKSRQAVVTDQERQMLRDLAQMNLLDEVINVLVLYTMQKTKSANLNKTYLFKVANDFSYKQIQTAEQAILYWRQPIKPVAKPVKPIQTNVPEWSNQDYKQEASQEELAELERLKREMLGQHKED